MTAHYVPSVHAARQALGATIEKRAHPSGARGAEVSLEEVCKRICEGKDDPYVRGWAGQVLVAAGKPKDPVNQAQALLDEFRKKTMYRPDPINTEMIVAPKHTLCLIEGGLCIPIRDCDDGTVVLGSACLSAGIQVRVVGQSFEDESVPTHVLLAVDTPGGWKRVEPSHDSFPVGYAYPAKREWWIDPIANHSISLSGLASGTFIGVGEPGVLSSTETPKPNPWAIGLVVGGLALIGAALAHGYRR